MRPLSKITHIHFFESGSRKNAHRLTATTMISTIRKSFLGLSFAAIPVIAPLWAPSGGFVPGRKQVGEVPLPQLTAQQWKILPQQQGADQKRLHIDVDLTVDHGRIAKATVRSASDYPDIDRAIVNWIAANWKLAPWFVGGEHFIVSLDVDPALRQVVFRNT
jgi:hypothetical protein